MDHIILLFFLLFIGSPISIFIHELGHAIAAISVRANNVEITIGSGQEICRLKWKQYTLRCHRLYFIGGFSKYERRTPFIPKEMIWITILGPAFNGIAAVIIFFLFKACPNNYLQLFFWFNIWLAFTNLIPLCVNGKQTDGYTIMQLIRK